VEGYYVQRNRHLRKGCPGTYVEGDVMFFIPLNEKPAKMIKVYSKVDKLINAGPPLIRDVDSSWSGDERVWRDFGFRKTEFPSM